MINERQDYITMITFELGNIIHVELLNLLTLEQLKTYYSEMIAWLNGEYFLVFIGEQDSGIKRIMRYKQFTDAIEFIKASNFIGLELLLRALKIQTLEECR